MSVAHQSSPRRTVVFSDIHLGPGGLLTTFRDADVLGRTIDRIAASERPTDLVLAGDTFDFLQCPGYTGFLPARCQEHFERIVGNAEYGPLWAALGRFAHAAGHRLAVLAGNHDPELLHSDVRAAFARLLGVDDTAIRWLDDEPPLLDSCDGRPAVFGFRTVLTSGEVWVVHGDRWDSVNAVDRDAVREAIRNGIELALPPGSVLVYEVLSKLKQTTDRRWLDVLKPEVATVLPLLLYLAPQDTARHLKQHWRTAASLVCGKLHGFATAQGTLDSSESDASATTPLDVALRSIAMELGTSPGNAIAELREAMNHGFAGAGPTAAGQLAVHTGLRRCLLRAWIRQAQKSPQFCALDGSDETPDLAASRLPAKVVALVAGHTHGPRRFDARAPQYWNSGTWLPVGRLADGDVEAAIDAIEQGVWASAPVPRTAVVIDELGFGPEHPVRLLRAQDTGDLEELP